MRNIYAARLQAAAKPPHHLMNHSFSGGVGGSGGASNSASFSSVRERNHSDSTLTAKEKARQFEQKRRDEEKRKREVRCHVLW